MFCKYCGSSLPDGVKFCPACGKPTPRGSAGAASDISSAANTLEGSVSPRKPEHFAHASDPAVRVKKTYNIGNFIFWAGCAIAMLGLFLPYCSVSLLGFGEDVALMETEDGIFFLGIILVLAVLNIFKLNILCIIGSLFHMSLVLYENDNIKSYARGLAENEIGHTLLFLGSITMILASIAALVMWIKKKKKCITYREV